MQGLKNILARILKTTPNYEQKSKEFEVHKLWEEAVGAQISKHCWPVRLYPDGVLIVVSESSVWLHQLRFLEAEILSKLEKTLKDNRVKQLRFQLGSKHPSTS